MECNKSDQKFSIGDRVWFAQVETKSYKVPCSDCLGQRALTVIMGDGEHVSINCSACERGYYGSDGVETKNQYLPAVRSGIVRGVECSGERIEYKIHISEHSYWSPKAVFATEAEARADAEVLRLQSEEQAHAEFLRREKPTRSWAFNAGYHRREIKEGERRLAYHRAKLAVAKVKAKEPESAA